MTVQQLIECLQRVGDKSVPAVFADGIEIVAVYDLNNEVVLTDAESE